MSTLHTALSIGIVVAALGGMLVLFSVFLVRAVMDRDRHALVIVVIFGCVALALAQRFFFLVT